MKLCIGGEDRQRCQERPLLSPAAGNRRRRRRAADSLQLLWPIWPQKPEWWENRESDRGWKWRWSRPRRLQAGCPPPHPAGRQGPHVPCSSFRPRRSLVGRVWPALGEQPSAAFADIFKAMSVAIPQPSRKQPGTFLQLNFVIFSQSEAFDSSMGYTLPWKVDLWHFQGYPIMLVGSPHRRPAYFSVIHLFWIHIIICWEENI